nr:hypothetical protein GCM10020063_056320 [Dactylosporangium thailandense]
MPTGPRERLRRLSAATAPGLTVAAAATAAGANFVPWPVAVGLGAVSGGAGLAGGLLWQQRTARRALSREWDTLVDPGPALGSAEDSDSLLAALNPDREIVGFSPLRDAEVRRLLRWCDEPSPQRLWLMTGDAGSGKTRLLVEAVARLEKPWLSGWVRRGKGAAAVAAAAGSGRPVLLIVDDADTYPDLADMLVKVVRDSDDVRVVAAARDTAGWWSRVRAGLEQDVDVAMPASPQVRLTTLTPDASSQRQRFAQAIRHFARSWDVPAPAANLVSSDAPVSMLLVHAAAAVTVRDGLSGRVVLDDAVRRLFDIEERWWQDRAVSAGLPAIGLPLLRSAIVAGVLLGADDLDDAVQVLRRLPGLTGARAELLRDLALWIRGLYPAKAGGWLSPHLPGRLVERYVVGYLVANPSQLAAIASAAVEPTERQPAAGIVPGARPARLVSTLANAARYEPAAAQALRGLLREERRLLPVAIQAARNGIGPIDEAVAAAVNATGLSADELAALDELIPNRLSQNLIRTAVAVISARLALPDTAEGRARHLTRLSRWLPGLGRHTEALAAAEEAVVIMRRLTETDAAVYEPGLGAALLGFDTQLSSAGRQAEALAASEEAVTIFRRMVIADPTSYTPQLAKALHGLMERHHESRRRDEALVAIEEAVALLRSAHGTDPDGNDAALARALDDYAFMLSDGRLSDAITATEEALAIRRRLAAIDPAAHEEDLARSLDNLCARLPGTGDDRDRAVAAAEEAVSIRRRLAAFNPVINERALATALHNLADALADSKRLEDALAAVREAIGIFRRLEAANSGSGKGLAYSLYTLGRLRIALPEGLKASGEAVTILRRLAETDPAGGHDSMLAMALSSLAIGLAGTTGRRTDALTAAEEAVAVYQRLAVTHPAYQQDLARAKAVVQRLR